jgi:RNA polymerase sigma-70 factor (ECF subfamily)
MSDRIADPTAAEPVRDAAVRDDAVLMELLASDVALVDRLRAGDEAVFAELVNRYSAAMLRVAQLYVRSRSIAEEVVQDAWIGVLNGIARFEGRSSLKTWIFRIVSNKAKTRAVKEGRSVPFSELGPEEASVAPERFRGPDDRYPGHWAAFPSDWARIPEERLLATETLAQVEHAIAELPPAQAIVITMRDVEGFDADDVCDALEISEGNQRVLLHRARSKVRQALEDYLDAA